MDPQSLVNGVLLGGVYGCVGIGFSLVWGVTNVINLTHGALIMLGAYVTFWTFRGAGVDPFLTVPLAMAATGALGWLMQRYLLNFVVRSGVFMTLILTFGLQLVLIDAALFAFTGDYRSVTPSYGGTGFEVGPVVVPWVRLGIFGVSLLLTGCLHLFMTRTWTGNAIRATALNRDAALLVGVDIGRIYATTFAIGAALAGAAGALLSTLYTITPVMGQPLLGKAFVIACLGGLGTMWGALIGGIVLGLAETAGAAVIGPSYQQAISFGLLVLILAIRPEGIAGKRFFAEIK
ncbi:MAG: branched-chain amino acid ABC transporter permease [Candidatus Rokuibacteriota bacterium]